MSTEPIKTYDKVIHDFTLTKSNNLTPVEGEGVTVCIVVARYRNEVLGLGYFLSLSAITGELW